MVVEIFCYEGTKLRRGAFVWICLDSAVEKDQQCSVKRNVRKAENIAFLLSYFFTNRQPSKNVLRLKNMGGGKKYQKPASSTERFWKQSPLAIGIPDSLQEKHKKLSHTIKYLRMDDIKEIVKLWQLQKLHITDWNLIMGKSELRANFQKSNKYRRHA